MMIIYLMRMLMMKKAKDMLRVMSKILSQLKEPQKIHISSVSSLQILL